MVRQRYDVQSGQKVISEQQKLIIVKTSPDYQGLG